ncbi:hypothetical protein HPP92_008179 [Vanilla planifolia]|uniref:glutathione transferase n=1 Tax=Vanilla planifolia TaxID=51239 RepID=A0A835V3J1_VANPL|nr:hypothetical protein HPP92_008179 [Vanilla planifolia]
MAASPMVRVIYGKPMLPDVARVLACLHEKEIKFHLADMNNGDQMPPDIINLQISSHGHTPGLQDGTVELFGSRKICRHIVENYGAYGYQYLLGKDPLARVTVEQWIQSEEQNFDPPSSALVFYLAYKIESDEEPISQSEKKLVKVLNLYEKRLDECEFLAGNYFTLADLYHLPNSHYLESSKEFGHLFKDRKNVSRWWKSITSRNSWKKVVQILDREGLLPKIALADNEAKKPSFTSKTFPGKNDGKNKFTEQKERTKEEQEEKATPPPSKKESSQDQEKEEHHGEPKDEIQKDRKDEISTETDKAFDHSKEEKKYEATDTISESRKEAARSKATESTPTGNNKSSDQNKVEKGTEGSGPDTGDKKDRGEKRDEPTSDGKKEGAETEHEEKATPPQFKEKSGTVEEKKEHDGEPKTEVKKDGKDEHSTKSHKEFDHSKGDKTFEATDTTSESRKGTTGSTANDISPPGNNKSSDQIKAGKGTEGTGLDSEDKKDTGENKDGSTSDVKDNSSSSNNKGSDKNINKETYTREENKKVEDNKAEREVTEGTEKSDANNERPAPDKEGRSKENNEKTKSNEKGETPNPASDGKKDSAATSERDNFPSGVNKNPDLSIKNGGASN